MHPISAPTRGISGTTPEVESVDPTGDYSLQLNEDYGSYLIRIATGRDSADSLFPAIRIAAAGLCDTISLTCVAARPEPVSGTIRQSVFDATFGGGRPRWWSPGAPARFRRSEVSIHPAHCRWPVRAWPLGFPQGTRP